MTFQINPKANVISSSTALIVTHAFMINGVNYDVTINDSDQNLGSFATHRLTADLVKDSVQKYFSQVAKYLGDAEFGTVQVVFDKARSVTDLTSVSPQRLGSDLEMNQADFATEFSENSESSFAAKYPSHVRFTLDHATTYLYERAFKPCSVTESFYGPHSPPATIVAAPSKPTPKQTIVLPPPARVKPLDATPKATVAKKPRKTVLPKPTVVPKPHLATGKPMPVSSTASAPPVDDAAADDSISTFWKELKGARAAMAAVSSSMT